MTALRLPRLDTVVRFGADWWPRLGPAFALVACLALWALWNATASSLVVEVDGRRQGVRTHRRDVTGVLLDVGYQPRGADRVSPPLHRSLRNGDVVSLSRATPYLISVDDQLLEIRSWGATIGEVLADAEVAVSPYDTVLVNDVSAGLEYTVPDPKVGESLRTYRRAVWDGREVEPHRISIDRAAQITVDDGSLPFEIRSSAQTVGEALREAEITIYLGDIVRPSLGSEVVSGMRVLIHRSRPVAFEVDGRVIRTRTRGETVADALAEAKIGLSALDEVTPDLESKLRDGEQVSIVRVQEDVEIDEEIAPFATVYEPDANLPIDTQQLISPGAEGITRSRYRVRYEDGQEVTRILEDTWVAQEPADRAIAFGQRIDPRTFTGPDGTQYTYWRRIRMLASSYSAGTAGVSPDKPYYGQTYTGDRMRFGIVAVDPAVVPLRSKVYVPGYGEGDALDIGSAIRARRIDLGYDDSNLVLWSKWVDVYLLWPPPPASQITWVLPNWPRPPQ